MGKALPCHGNHIPKKARVDTKIRCANSIKAFPSPKPSPANNYSSSFPSLLQPNTVPPTPKKKQHPSPIKSTKTTTKHKNNKKCEPYEPYFETGTKKRTSSLKIHQDAPPSRKHRCFSGILLSAVSPRGRFSSRFVSVWDRMPPDTIGAFGGFDGWICVVFFFRFSGSLVI